MDFTLGHAAFQDQVGYLLKIKVQIHTYNMDESQGHSERRQVISYTIYDCILEKINLIHCVNKSMIVWGD